MGALFAGMLANETLVDRAVFIAGGLPVSEVAARSLHPRLLTIRHWRRKNCGIKDQETHRRKLRESIEKVLDETRAPRVGRKDLVVMGSRDLIIPTDTQHALARKLGSPDVIRISGGHLMTILMSEIWYADHLCTHLAN